MRIFVWCLTMLAVGGVVGAIYTNAEFAGTKERFDPKIGAEEREAGMSDVLKESGKALPPAKGATVEVTNGTIHDFGSMESNGTGSHAFQLRNSGSSLLKLQSGGTSCKACTIAGLESNEIRPGEVTTVTVDWVVSSPDPEYRKEAYILTNDPDRPTIILVVKGKVIKSVRLEDEEIKLGAVSATEGRVGKCRIYCFREDKFEIVSSSLSNAETADRFVIETRPLTSEELATREGALQGFEVTASAKPGLPLGTILQTIRVNTNWEDWQKIEIPIRGNVVSDISIIGGKNFDSTGNVFKLGVVSRDEGKLVHAQIAIKGAERRDVKFEVADIDPASSLKVTFGESKEINDGAVVLVPLTIEVPAGSLPVSRLGGPDRKDYGRIMIKTTHSLSKELQLLVRFAVQ